MQLFGIGIDVVEVARIEQSIVEFGDRFLERIFAVSKAFGTGIGKDIAWLDLEVARRPSGEPEMILSGRAKAFAEENNATVVKVSLTHAEHYAAANAVVLSQS